MSRRRSAEKRIVTPDAKYGSVLVAKLINYMMVSGKRSISEKAVYSALEVVSTTLGVEPLEAFETAVNNVRPLIEVRSKRVGGATYQVPTDVRPARSLFLALRAIIKASRSRKDKRKIADKLAAEIMDAHGGRGEAVKFRETKHKMAEANKAFAHYSW
jgi:small subunit ribosomal protein S7